MIGSVCISTKNTSVISVSLKFGTMWSWGGATHKLKPSPFRPTPVLQKLCVLFRHLTLPNIEGVMRNDVSRMMCKRHIILMQENCRSENMLTHETANRAQSNMSEWAKTNKFHTKLTQLLITRNIGVRWNLTKSYINILNMPLKPMIYLAIQTLILLETSMTENRRPAGFTPLIIHQFHGHPRSKDS